MANKHIQYTTTSKLDRTFAITKVCLVAMPILAYLYLMMSQAVTSYSIPELFAQQPSLTILFLIAMLQPYAAYLLHLVQKKHKEGNRSFVMMNLSILLLAELLTMNVFLIALLVVLCYQVFRLKGYSLKSIPTWSGKSLIYQGGGSLLIVMLSSICLFATIQMM